VLTPLGAGWRSKLEVAVEKLQLEFSVGHPPQPDTRIEVDSSAAEGLWRYLDLLIEWNSRVDLTAARDNDELFDLMVSDALVLHRFAVSGQRWVDVGSGAGAPGLALSLLNSRLRVTLVEPRQKRVAFLRAVVGTLGIAGANVERARAEDLTAGSWDTAVSRATFAPEEWLRHGSALAGSAVWVLLARAEAPKLEGWVPDLDVDYEWPLVGVARRAVRYVPEHGI
jgi:16S rRNA (guanine527-N7)-methyltransferase